VSAKRAKAGEGLPIRMLHDRVLVSLENEGERKSGGGILIPATAAVGKRLWVTEHTVKFHLTNIYRKLNVSNRTEAARWAQMHGLVEDLVADGALESAGLAVA